MPTYTSPFARSLMGWDLHDGRSDRYVKNRMHKIERQFARAELDMLTLEHLDEMADEARFAIAREDAAIRDSWVVDYAEAHADAFDARPGLYTYDESTLGAGLDDEDEFFTDEYLMGDDIPELALSECGWGANRVDFSEFSGGFSVRTRP